MPQHGLHQYKKILLVLSGLLVAAVIAAFLRPMGGFFQANFPPRGGDLGEEEFGGDPADEDSENPPTDYVLCDTGLPGVCAEGHQRCVGDSCSVCEAFIAPGSAEVCSDQLDNDCDGERDESACVAAECADGIDNDSDARVDFVQPRRGSTNNGDPHCLAYTDNTELSDCSDGIDNDHDLATDFPDDPACASPDDMNEQQAVDCDDNRDNDGDGRADYPWDPGCESLLDDDEHSVMQCDDGLSNDFDGLVDTDDPGCASLHDRSELNTAFACDDGRDNDGDFEIDFPEDSHCPSPVGIDESTWTGETEDDNACSTGGDCMCGQECSASACSIVSAPAPCLIPGDSTGDGRVTCADARCTLSAATGLPLDPSCLRQECMDVSPLGTPNGRIDIADASQVLRLARQLGYVCDATQTDPDDAPSQPIACVQAECYDGIDNDGDGLLDFPQDPGCESMFDTGEAYACDDGIDNDADGETDYSAGTSERRSRNARADRGCSMPNDHSETGDYTCDNGIDDDSDGRTDFPDDRNCSSAIDITEAPDCSDGIDNDGDGFTDTPADAQCTTEFDPSELAACSDEIDNDRDGLADELDTGCEGDQDESEKPQCGDGIDNDGDGRADRADASCSDEYDVSEFPDCSDGIDNDADGSVDYSHDASGRLGGNADAGCSALTDTTETDAAIACDNGIDDDSDGHYDYSPSTNTTRTGRYTDGGTPTNPTRGDRGCGSATGATEQPQCDDRIDNDLDNAMDMLDPGCAASYEDNERSIATCDNGLDDDGDGAADYPFDTGCENQSDQDEQNYACNDKADNDGDRYRDYPDDPGCASRDDNNERSNVKCDNGIDDDGDGVIDFPHDPACLTPRGTSERNTLVECDDGIDNDYDGRTDGDDIGCSSLLDPSERGASICDNGIDDDSDGRTDYRTSSSGRDPDCSAPSDNTEASAGPTGRRHACDDGIDNDYDGIIDYPADPGCDGYSDDYEWTGYACDDYTNISGMWSLLDNDYDGLANTFNDPGCFSVFDTTEQYWTSCDDSLDNDNDRTNGGGIDFNGWPPNSPGSPIYTPADPSCGNNPLAREDGRSTVACSNEIDDDNDGLIDYGRWSTSDPGCSSLTDTSESSGADCDDNRDNDGDELFDFPDDPGCDSATDEAETIAVRQCDDGIDNDDDDAIDSNDGGCYDAYDDSELNDPGEGTECDDGYDNDRDGAIDLDDAQCGGSPFGTSEGTDQGPACANDRIDSGESDVDCGGATECPRCEINNFCVTDGDCYSQFCEAGVCVDPCGDTGNIAPGDTGPGGPIGTFDTGKLLQGNFMNLGDTGQSAFVPGDKLSGDLDGQPRANAGPFECGRKADGGRCREDSQCVSNFCHPTRDVCQTRTCDTTLAAPFAATLNALWFNNHIELAANGDLPGYDSAWDNVDDINFGICPLVERYSPVSASGCDVVGAAPVLESYPSADEEYYLRTYAPVTLNAMVQLGTAIKDNSWAEYSKIHFSSFMGDNHLCSDHRRGGAFDFSKVYRRADNAEVTISSLNNAAGQAELCSIALKVKAELADLSADQIKGPTYMKRDARCATDTMLIGDGEHYNHFHVSWEPAAR